MSLRYAPNGDRVSTSSANIIASALGFPYFSDANGDATHFNRSGGVAICMQPICGANRAEALPAKEMLSFFSSAEVELPKHPAPPEVHRGHCCATVPARALPDRREGREPPTVSRATSEGASSGGGDVWIERCQHARRWSRRGRGCDGCT